MAKKVKSEKAERRRRIDLASQFRGVNTRDHPSLWPPLPRNLLCVFIIVAVFAALWFAWVRHSKDDLEAARQQEVTLRNDYTKDLQKAVSLDLLKQQLAQVEQYVALLERQLPGKAEMDALLSDINQAGLGRSLQFELFKPGNFEVKQYYGELPIAIRITGDYHDIGAFTADVANLSRIVTLNDVLVEPTSKGAGVGDGQLTMSATAKTYRYLDEEEIAAQQAAQEGAK